MSDPIAEAWAAVENEVYVTSYDCEHRNDAIMAAVREAMLAAHDDLCKCVEAKWGPCIRRQRITTAFEAPRRFAEMGAGT